MSLVFAKEVTSKQKYPPGQSTVQKLLDENAALIQTIVEFQNAGRIHEAAEYQQILHRNLVYLANLADDSQSLLSELQAPLDQAPSTVAQQQAQPSAANPNSMVKVEPADKNAPESGKQVVLQHGQNFPQPTEQHRVVQPGHHPVTTGASFFATNEGHVSQGQYVQQQQQVAYQLQASGNQSVTSVSSAPPQPGAPASVYAQQPPQPGQQMYYHQQQYQQQQPGNVTQQQQPSQQIYGNAYQQQAPPPKSQPGHVTDSNAAAYYQQQQQRYQQQQQMAQQAPYQAYQQQQQQQQPGIPMQFVNQQQQPPVVYTGPPQQQQQQQQQIRPENMPPQQQQVSYNYQQQPPQQQMYQQTYQQAQPPAP